MLSTCERNWERTETSYSFSFCLFFSQSFIWNISKDFQSILFSLYAEKILLTIAYFLLLSCNTFHAVLCQISMVWQFALDDYFVGDLPYFFYCLLFQVNVCICFFFLFSSMPFTFLQILTYGVSVWLWANGIEKFWSINSSRLICASLNTCLSEPHQLWS